MKAALPEGVTVTVRTGEETDYLFVQNWNPEDVAVTVEEKLTDFESGERIGAGDSLKLSGYSVRILERPAGSGNTERFE